MKKIDYSKYYDSILCPKCMAKISSEDIIKVNNDLTTMEYGEQYVVTNNCAVCKTQVLKFKSRSDFTILTILLSTPLLVLIIYSLKTSSEKDLPLVIFCCFWFLVIDCCLVAACFRKRFKLINVIKQIESNN